MMYSPIPSLDVQAGKRQQTETVDDSVTISEAEVLPKLLELAARFNQASVDLQYVGICRPSKRRRDSVVQRTFFAPGQL